MLKLKLDSLATGELENERLSLSVRTICRSDTCHVPGPSSVNDWLSEPPGAMVCANTGYSWPR